MEKKLKILKLEPTNQIQKAKDDFSHGSALREN